MSDRIVKELIPSTSASLNVNSVKQSDSVFVIASVSEAISFLDCLVALLLPMAEGVACLSADSLQLAAIS